MYKPLQKFIENPQKLFSEIIQNVKNTADRVQVVSLFNYSAQELGLEVGDLGQSFLDNEEKKGLKN